MLFNFISALAQHLFGIGTKRAMRRKIQELSAVIEAVTENRDECFYRINEIARAVGMRKDNAAPDAVVRNVNAAIARLTAEAADATQQRAALLRHSELAIDSLSLERNQAREEADRLRTIADALKKGRAAATSSIVDSANEVIAAGAKRARAELSLSDLRNTVREAAHIPIGAGLRVGIQKLWQDKEEIRSQYNALFQECQRLQAEVAQLQQERDTLLPTPNKPDTQTL